MKVITTPLKDLLLVEFAPMQEGEPESVELFAGKSLAQAGLSCGHGRVMTHRFTTACISPLWYAQAKQPRMCSVMEGVGWVVAVDLRTNSDTFSRYYGVELSYASGLSLLLPPGFAFGVANRENTPLTMIEISDMPEQAYLFNPLDASLAIRWPSGLSTCSANAPLLQVQDGIRNHLFMKV